MRKRSLDFGYVALFASLLWLSTSCGDDERPPPSQFNPVMTGGNGGNGGSGGSRSSGGRSTGGTSGGDSGSGGLAGGSGEPGAGSGGEGGGSSGGGGVGNRGATGGGGNETAEGGALLTGPDLECPDVTPAAPSGTPLCDPEAEWGEGELVLSDPQGNDVLLALTSDELTVAWRFQDGLMPTLWVADRETRDAEFGEPQAVSDPASMNPSQIALSPTRLRLLVVAGGQFVEFVRTTLEEPFAFAGPGYFGALNADAGAQARSLADPVLAADDQTLFYSLDAPLGSEGTTLHVSKRTGAGDFPVGSVVDACELSQLSSGARRPTGVSADLLTLFYYDEPRVRMRAAWRPALDRPFDRFVDLPLHSAVMPNAACDRLYYSSLTDQKLEIYAADEQ
jgi:hypothetical protein